MTIKTARRASLEFVCVFGHDDVVMIGDRDTLKTFVAACLNKGSSVGLTFIVSDAGVSAPVDVSRCVNLQVTAKEKSQSPLTSPAS